MEAAGFSEILTPNNQATWHQISEDPILVNQMSGV